MDGEIMTREMANFQEDRHHLPDANFTKYDQFKLTTKYEKFL